jgi:parvulin-like peptidyl-prolyl isomerase
VLSLLVQARIIENLAEEHGATIDEATVEERFDEQAELAGGEEALASALADSNLTLDLFRDVLLPAQLLIEALRDTVDTVDTRTVRHILLETEAEALDVVAALEGGADFAELAEERSQDPGSAQEGGSLGPAPRGSYVPEFEEAAWAAELDEVVGPIATDFGYHVLEVSDEDELVADDLDEFERDQFVEAELNRLITEAFAEAQVVIGPGLGIGILTGMATSAIGRNPDAAPQIRATFIIGAAFAEGLGVLAVVVGILAIFIG